MQFSSQSKNAEGGERNYTESLVSGLNKNDSVSGLVTKYNNFLVWKQGAVLKMKGHEVHKNKFNFLTSGSSLFLHKSPQTHLA